MERLLQRALIGLAVVVAVAGVAAAMVDACIYADRLPVSATFGCANCHVGADAVSVPSAADLNAFGLAFQQNGYVWDSSLAYGNADNDGCTNGLELGDADGNGQPDQHQTAQSSNPADRDCTGTSIDETTWGALKSLFNSN